MRYWWVNQNQTYQEERNGGYMWSPKRKANGVKNAFYEFMREVRPGDLVFSFCRMSIPSIGRILSPAYDYPKPDEFGAGHVWDNDGWRVDVEYVDLENRIVPRDHMEILQDLLPARYAPLNEDGRGRQSVYLTKVPIALAEALLGLIGDEAQAHATDWAASPVILSESSETRSTTHRIAAEEAKLDEIEHDQTIPETERDSLVRSRIGQGEFRRRLVGIEGYCRVTGVANPGYLIASHIKPWRTSTNEERIDGNNGLLLTPDVDRLFDRGLISFNDDGALLVSTVADRESLNLMGIPPAGTSTGSFNVRQRAYMAHHRSHVFKKADLPG